MALAGIFTTTLACHVPQRIPIGFGRCTGFENDRGGITGYTQHCSTDQSLPLDLPWNLQQQAYASVCSEHDHISISLLAVQRRHSLRCLLSQYPLADVLRSTTGAKPSSQRSCR